MVSYYDELEIEDFAWDPVAKVYHYPCPCGDRFEISKGQLRDGEEIAFCPSCSLMVRVIYDYMDWEDYESDDEDEGEGEEDEDDNEDEDTPATSSRPSPAPVADVAEAKAKAAEPVSQPDDDELADGVRRLDIKKP